MAQLQPGKLVGYSPRPLAWPADVLARIPDTPHSRLADFLPWNSHAFQTLHFCRILGVVTDCTFATNW